MMTEAQQDELEALRKEAQSSRGLLAKNERLREALVVADRYSESTGNCGLRQRCNCIKSSMTAPNT